MPLWTSGDAAVLTQTWGWELMSFGSPWVAQRVWPMPSVPGRERAVLRFCIRGSADGLWHFSIMQHGRPVATQMPAESYPRYSRRAKAVQQNGRRLLRSDVSNDSTHNEIVPPDQKFTHSDPAGRSCPPSRLLHGRFSSQNKPRRSFCLTLRSQPLCFAVARIFDDCRYAHGVCTEDASAESSITSPLVVLPGPSARRMALADGLKAMILLSQFCDAFLLYARTVQKSYCYFTAAAGA